MHKHVVLTLRVDVVGQEEIEFSDGDVDVVWVDTQTGVEAVRRLLKPLTIRAF